MAESNGTKVCSKCKQEKSLSEGFYKDRSRKDEFAYRCRLCMATVTKIQIDPSSLKICGGCNEKKSLKSFYKDNHRVNGFASRCSSCMKMASESWRRKNLEKRRVYKRAYGRTEKAREKVRKRYAGRLDVREKVRIFKLRWKYGMSESQYNDILKLQSGKCAICKGTSSKVGKRVDKVFSVDHDKKSGKIRGLLCLRCNLALGFFGDSLDAFRAAMLYLIKPPAERLSIQTFVRRPGL